MYNIHLAKRTEERCTPSSQDLVAPQKQKKMTKGIIWREVQEVQNESQVSNKKRNSLVPGKTPSFIRLNEFSVLFLHFNPRDNPA